MSSSKVLYLIKNTKTGANLGSFEADKNIPGSVERIESEVSQVVSGFNDPNVKSFKTEQITGKL